MPSPSSQDPLLLSYVSNLDDTVYCIKNLPEEVIAVLFAYVSRSPETFRQNLFKLLGSQELGLSSTEDLYSTRTDLALAKEKACQFHEKWVVGYGHASVAEHADLKFAIDSLSILAAKALEDNRFGRYTEKSSRYQVFERGKFYCPPCIQASALRTEYEDTLNFLLETYTEFFQPIKNFVEERFPQQPEQNEKAYANSIKAKVCDIIRGILPAASLTMIGMSINSRAAGHLISKLLSSPLEELQILGEKMLCEGQKICPTLLKYIGKSDYFHKTPKAIASLNKKFIQTKESISDPSLVKLVFASADCEEHLLTSILYEQSELTYEELFAQVKLLFPSDREEILNEYLQRRGKFQWPGRALENCYFMMEICCDYGTFRDIQRHRVCTQINQKLTPLHGYVIPEEIVQAGLKDKYEIAMRKAAEFYQKVEVVFPEEASYVLPLAFRKKTLFTWNLRELEHFIRLRSSQQGHKGYRRIAQDCYRLIADYSPFLAKCLTVDFQDYDLERLEAETRIQKGLTWQRG